MKWIANKATCIDADTGELITPRNAKKNYTKLKTIKKTHYNATHTIGYIEYITEYTKKGKQLEIIF